MKAQEMHKAIKMVRENMRAIKEECEKHDEDCVGCPLKNEPGDCPMKISNLMPFEWNFAARDALKIESQYWNFWWGASEDEFEPDDPDQQMCVPTEFQEWMSFNELFDMTREELEKHLKDCIEDNNTQAPGYAIDGRVARWAASEFVRIKNEVRKANALGQRVTT